LIVNNSITLAKISEDREGEIPDIVEELRNNELIIKKHLDFIERFERIVVYSEQLSNQIGKNVVIKIEKGNYNTRCPECENSI
jgi:hypothetical protein